MTDRKTDATTLADVLNLLALISKAATAWPTRPLPKQSGELLARNRVLDDWGGVEA